MIRHFSTIPVFVVSTLIALSWGLDAQDKRSLQTPDLLIINEDCGHFFVYHKSSEMNVAGLQRWVDFYSDGAVTHLFICPNAMRASFRSKTRDAIWDPVSGKEPTHKWPQNAKKLHDAGIDPYRVWIDRCRTKNISPWLTMRMNDVHQSEDRSNFQHSTFWRKNIPLWREPNHEHGSGLNYVHAAVRKHQMDFIKELLERYDPDGLELDWMRFPNHLTPGKEFEERIVLTRFMREVRSLVDHWSKKRGRQIKLGVRAPANPEDAASRGIDAAAWGKEGLVDLIVACPFYFSSDFDIPIELWQRTLSDSPRKVVVVPGFESSARPWISGVPVGNTMETLNAFAASSYHRGAKGVYLFNWMESTDWPVSASDYRKLLRDGVRKAAAAPRRHPVCFRDIVAPGKKGDTQLPADAQKGKSFRVNIGPSPKTGKAWIIAGISKRAGMNEAQFQARLNGMATTASSDSSSIQSFGGGTARAVRFQVPVSAVKPGYNSIELRQVAGETGQQIVWVELRLEP